MSQKVVLFLLVAVLLIPTSRIAAAQQPPAPVPAPGQTLSAGQLDDLVAPIALYPDPLISQILVAATYPLELVEANQWLQHNPNLTGAALTEAVTKQNWDPSVQALVAFPDVMKFLTEDIAWTTNLGNAFLAQESEVMDAVQRMRARAAQNGKLNSSPQEVVTQTYDAGRPVYEILPAQPDVIYVPYYDPFWIWGDPLFYPYPHWYYPPHAHVLYYSPPISLRFYYGAGWQGWNYWGWRPGWTTRTVVVNNTFVHRYNFNSTHLTNFSGTTTWTHDVTHRQGVPYPSQALTERYRTGVRENLNSRTLSVGGGRPAPAQAVRPSPVRSNAPSGPRQGVPNDRVGAREVSPNAPNRDRSAFGSVENGEASRLHSDHGYSSLGPNRSRPVQVPQRGAGQQAPVVHQAPQTSRPAAPVPRQQAPAAAHPSAPAQHAAPQAPRQSAPAPSHSNNRGNGGGKSEGRR